LPLEIRNPPNITLLQEQHDILQPIRQLRTLDIDELHKQWVRVVSTNGLALSLVDDDEFRKFLHLLQPSYQGLSRKVLTMRYLPEVCWMALMILMLTLVLFSRNA
jgi:hypothetical protein